MTREEYKSLIRDRFISTFRGSINRSNYEFKSREDFLEVYKKVEPIMLKQLTDDFDINNCIIIIPVITYNSLIIDHNTYLVHYKGEKYSLPAKEFLTLSLLTKNPDIPFSAYDIMEIVWQKETTINTIRDTIFRLRKRFGEDFIKNHIKIGYSLNTKVVF